MKFHGPNPLKSQYRGLPEGFKTLNWRVPTPHHTVSLSAISEINMVDDNQSCDLGYGTQNLLFYFGLVAMAQLQIECR